MTRRHQCAAAIVLLAACGLVIGTGDTGSDGSRAATQAQVASDPFAGYRASTSPLLSDSAIAAIAKREAANAGERSPTSITATDTTLADAMRAITGNETSPNSPGEATFRQSTVVVVTLRGQFQLNAPTPPGRPEPQGTALTLLIDAHTGQVEGRGIEASEPSSLAELGAQRRIG